MIQFLILSRLAGWSLSPIQSSVLLNIFVKLGSCLCCVAALYAQVIDPPQKKFQGSVCRSRCILWHCVTCQIVSHKCQAPLGVPSALEAPTGRIIEQMACRIAIIYVIKNLSQSLMVRDVKVQGLGYWVCLETLKAVPGHILNGDDGTVSEEEKVKHSVPDDGVVRSLDHRR